MPKNQTITVETADAEVTVSAPIVTTTVEEPKSALVLRTTEVGYDSEFLSMLDRAINSRAEYQFGAKRMTAKTVTAVWVQFLNTLARKWNRLVKDGEIIAPLASNYDALYSIYGKGTSAIDIRVFDEDSLRFAKTIAKIIGYDNYINLDMATDAIHLLTEDMATRPNNDKFGLADLQSQPANALSQILSAVA